MALNFLNIDINSISKRLNFTFLIDMGKSIFFSKNNEIDVTSKNLKSSIIDNTLFKINSEVVNIENNKQEVISSLDCFYSPNNEALCIIIGEKVKIKDLSKEFMVNIIDFASKVSAKSLILLLDKKNKDYVKIMQSMMMVGFINDIKNKTANLMEIEYKVLKFECKITNFEEIAF